MFRCLAGLLIVCAAGAMCAEQPVAFPHDKHIKLGLACIDCHIGADLRDRATIPSVQKCMLCHAKLLRNDAEVKKVIGYADKGIEIPWVRVYGFSTDAHVKFRHEPHYRAGIACATCHGDVAKMSVAEPVVKHDMGTCLTCHRQRNGPQDCAACHY
ncbi:MAG TPA: cytochrome c3 family protein [Bryobacteraceae bacterium]|nr:cytochrome c3 family protein [Bryobacteraceae bacterium]